MRHWLLKSEPSTFSIDHLAQRPGKRDSWTGVRNYQARNFLREMQRDDLALFYHSSAKETGVAGTVQIVRAAYPDATAFDPKDAHYDATADRSNPVWYTVDVRLERKFKRIVTLDELKRQRALTGMRLLQRGNRLSVMPIEDEHWELILGLE